MNKVNDITIVKYFALLVIFGLLAACSTKPASSQEQFMDNLREICGKSFAGKLVSSDDVDHDMAKLPMVMQVAACSDAEIRIPFHVGDNRSRTWVITKTGDGLRLKHQHNHKDGHEDKVSQYGGDTIVDGTASRQEFPVDQFSKDLFMTEGLDVSITNVWAVEITKDIYAYELRRKNRFFRVEFDLSKPVAAPHDPW
ncbi:MAG: hypothetical protein L3J04_10850 [Robiginitomaculum sp.]|nr:hypothetical protein [Robiginitomaculum sp.]